MNKFNVRVVIFTVTAFIFSGCAQQNKKLIATNLLPSQFANALMQSMGVQAHISVYYAETNEFPSSLEQMDILGLDIETRNALESINVVTGGIIKLTFNDGGVMKLVPVTSDVGSLGWDCETASYENVVPWCQYTFF